MADARLDPIDVYKIIGGRIRDERRKHELTQNELASRVGLKRTSITNVEKGKQKLLVHTLVDIARSLGTSPATFFTALDAEAPLALPEDLPVSVRNWIIHSVTNADRGHQK
jgi:transcriptional regulator with XRE-family HTH domain